MTTKKISRNFTHENFDSLQDFINFIKTKEPNKAFADYNLFKESGWKYFQSVHNSAEFAGTKSWEEAERLLANGYPEGAKKIMEGQSNILATSGIKTRREIAMVGGQPHVPNAIIGLPKQMIRTIKTPTPQRTVSIYYDCTASASTEVDTLATGGANAYAFIKYLEGKGIRVQLYAFRGVMKKDRRNIVTIKIKDYKQPINPLLVSYPLTHPSFFRRHLFRWQEVSENTNYEPYTSAYGNTMRYAYKNFADTLRTLGVLGKDDIYIDCISISSCKTIDQICQLAGINK